MRYSMYSNLQVFAIQPYPLFKFKDGRFIESQSVLCLSTPNLQVSQNYTFNFLLVPCHSVQLSRDKRMSCVNSAATDGNRNCLAAKWGSKKVIRPGPLISCIKDPGWKMTDRCLQCSRQKSRKSKPESEIQCQVTQQHNHNTTCHYIEANRGKISVGGVWRQSDSVTLLYYPTVDCWFCFVQWSFLGLLHRCATSCVLLMDSRAFKGWHLAGVTSEW